MPDLTEIIAEESEPDGHWQRQVGMLDAALPKLKCPVCSNLSFSLFIPKTGGLQTVKIIHRVVGDSSNYTTPAVMFEETIAVSCANCGYIMEFVEDGLKEMAERAGWKDRSDG